MVDVLVPPEPARAGTDPASRRLDAPPDHQASAPVRGTDRPVPSPAGTPAGRPTSAPALPSDVLEAHPYAAAIGWVTRLGLLDLDTSGAYRPLHPVVRHELAVALHRYAGRDDDAPPTAAVTGTTAQVAASDVPPDRPWSAAVAWVLRDGLLAPHADGTFRPARVVTRQELVVALHRAAGAPTATAPVPFRDVPTWHPATRPIAWAAEVGVVRGFPDGTVRPSWPLTRQTAALLLHRFDGVLG